jgi:hypothetical protein
MMMEPANSIPPATVDQQKYLDLAAYYAGRGMLCYGNDLWPEAATHFGSAMESLLRIRFGKGKLIKLVDKFDKDSLFNAIEFHAGEGKVCSTCVADHTRIMRNAVHPDCWKEATQKDVGDAAQLVHMLYHVLVACSSAIAIFQDSPDTTLSRMDAGDIFFQKTHSHR